MADAPASSKPASPKGLGFLTQKAGPFPLWVWLAAGVAIWYLTLRPKNTNPAAGQSATGYGTDPAGNTGYIDPESGYVYGSAEDIAALQQQGLVAANTYAQQAADASGTGGTTTGTGPAGPAGPAGPPGPAGSPAAQVSRYPAPGGLHVTGTTPATISVAWNNTTPPASSFTVATYQQNGKRVGYSTVSVPDAAAGKGAYTIPGLHTKWSYKIEVWANGGKTAPPHATVAATTK